MNPPYEDETLECEPAEDDPADREGPRDWQVAQDRYERWLREIWDP